MVYLQPAHLKTPSGPGSYRADGCPNLAVWMTEHRLGRRAGVALPLLRPQEQPGGPEPSPRPWPLLPPWPPGELSEGSPAAHGSPRHPRDCRGVLHNRAVCAVVVCAAPVQGPTPHPTRQSSGCSPAFLLDVATRVASTAEVPNNFPDLLQSSQAPQIAFTSTASKWPEGPSGLSRPVSCQGDMPGPQVPSPCSLTRRFQVTYTPGPRPSPRPHSPASQ